MVDGMLTYARARSLAYTTEYRLLTLMARGRPGGLEDDPAGPVAEAMREKERLFQRDIAHIREGLFPAAVLAPESPMKHLLRLPRILADGAGIAQRRANRKIMDFDDQARAYLDELPQYYQRNFHFQTNGYLSERSAELYDHQVEMLFGGMADAMRRIVIPPLKRAFGGSDGRGLTFLEIGAGTGRTTRFVKLAFPQARIVALDLSHPYLRVARKHLESFSRIDLLQGDGGELPFLDTRFDAVYSVFMFHELPLPARQAVMAESRRVLAPGGVLAVVDSMQMGDNPAVEPLLAHFPANYHEPYYHNYMRHPLEGLMAGEGFSEPETDFGGLSKVVWARRELPAAA